MSWSETAPCGNICATGLENADQLLASETDHLFWIEAARQAYSAYTKFPVQAEGGTTVLDVIRLEALMTDSIVLLQSTAHQFSVRDQYEGKKEEQYCNQNIFDHKIHLETEKIRCCC